MNKENLLKAIRTTNSRLFTVTFVKSNGEVRTMFAKTRVKRFLSKKPNKRKVSNVNENLIHVFDVEKKAYRSFKLDSVIEFRCNKVILNWGVKW